MFPKRTGRLYCASLVVSFISCNLLEWNVMWFISSILLYTKLIIFSVPLKLLCVHLSHHWKNWSYERLFKPHGPIIYVWKRWDDNFLESWYWNPYSDKSSHILTILKRSLYITKYRKVYLSIRCLQVNFKPYQAFCFAGSYPLRI